jgi:hypothetical protein
VQDTLQNPFHDFEAQHSLCSKGRAIHPVVSVGVGEGGPKGALDSGAVGCLHRESKAALVSVKAPVRGRESSPVDAGQLEQPTEPGPSRSATFHGARIKII